MAGGSRRNGGFYNTSGYVLLLIILGAVLAASMLVAVATGAADISVSDVYRVIFYELAGIGDPAYGSGSVHDIVWLIRLPRIVLAVGVGMGLSCSGVIMQAVMRNPMAEPYVLGISSGAYLGAVLAILLGVGSALGSNFIGILAFAGALCVSLLVLLIANIGSRANTTKLLLSGLALTAVCNSLANFVVYASPDRNGIQTVTYWLMGSLSSASWEVNALVIPIVLAGTLFFITQYRNLNLMLYGDETAITLGTDLNKWRHVYLLVCAALVGVLVYAAGMIGFVGLIIPHAVRMLVGTDHKRLIPAAALLGAIFLVWIDVCCRVLLKGNDLPVGVLTGLIGSPLFIYLMVHKKYGFGGQD